VGVVALPVEHGLGRTDLRNDRGTGNGI
jgi:hypothetical protein